jgi:hypothetical protein
MYDSLDVRVDHLPMSDVWSTLRNGNSQEAMLMTLQRKVFLAETAVAASALPCLHRSDANRRLGYVVALAGSSAR